MRRVAVRADRGPTAGVIARLRALAPAEVALMCFDEAYTRSAFELVPDVYADGVGGSWTRTEGRG